LLFFVLCCGGDLATTSMARSKRAHASGCCSLVFAEVDLAMARSDDGFGLDLTNPLHQAIGQAIESYVRVEQILALVLQAILKTDVLKAHAILFAVQNTRARNELFQSLLQMQFGAGIKSYWASCGKFLNTLSVFRNAVAHWHPYLNIYISKDKDAPPARVTHALGHPAIRSALKSLEVSDFAPFQRDCRHISQELSALVELVNEPPAALPEKFRRPIAHQNLAVLRPRPTAKAPQPQRPPSQPSALQKGRKPSAKQRRQRALREAAKGKP
jgi:hypothetical protein